MAPNGKVSEHPFYDYGIPPSEYIEERILLINDNVVESRIKVHGLPPSDTQEQRAWYRDALRDTLKLAAKTKLVPGIVSLASHGPSTSSIQGTGENLPITAAPQEPQLTDIDSEMTSPSNLCAGGQQAGLPNSAPPPDDIDFSTFDSTNEIDFGSWIDDMSECGTVRQGKD